MQQEIWLPVKGYEGLYEVSNIGRVKSLKRGGTNGKVLKQSKNTWGYLHLTLSKNNIHTDFVTHRLIAKHFINNESNKPQINHIDNDKLNNHISNLEWCTNRENKDHCLNQNRQARGESGGNSKLKEKDVADIRGSTLSKVKLSKKYSLHLSTIYRIKNKTSWQHI